MYECTDCGHRFERPETRTERHGLDNPPYETFAVCPTCKSNHFGEVRVFYCRYCGNRLTGTDSDYCNDECRRQGVRIRQKEALRLYKRQQHPVQRIITQLERYNAENGTRYSYGQFVALILPKIEKGDSAS